MPPNSETQEYIVVHDGQPNPDTNDLEVNSPSASANNSPITDRDHNSRRRSGRPGDSLDRLRSVPAVREIPWYEGKELPPEKSTESTRVQTRGACLLASRGEVKDPPCTHCATGVGRFAQCIASDEWFHGACATCQLATRGNLCSLRKKDTLRIKPEGKSKQQESDALRSIPRKVTSPQVEARIEPRLVVAQQQQLPLPPLKKTAPLKKAVVEDLETNSKKRKRETLQGTTVWKPYVSPYLPSVPSLPLNRIQTSLPNTPTQYSSSNPVFPPPGRPSQNEPSPLVNYIYQKGNTQNGAKQPHISPKAHPRKAITLQTNDSSSHDVERNGNRGREPTDSLSPSTQLLQPFHAAVEEKPHVQSFVPINADSRHAGPPDTPLFDALPRKRQKQIYGIIGGLQSGIRSCKQQAESMQKQLDLLQAALGIDTDDNYDGSVLG